ncbi:MULTISPECIES: DNA-directed RNA polymerase subunit alpha [Psychrilyobacter]|uniref:DNA-directed RNA polymerase subunit alpha n=1 Tax=Psychrilyobacter piezotolerans TaxID=2293438 RepID=A0ABX9KF58_9FUSO|nr:MULTISPECIES: DNA-directed RNA polymerase subunit alpha [Psychrilyobacter]MCS5422080.1 DNA-directed RNA polymerase subunit alpha [Psychrilyobacter sp. S5]NDI78646.1 DNA-directed RNA polymerase subunit alpha [Psychrilyobacter piezotolerans]RDE59997.1 DNA-directed RNA polymerase subunit alpha [Psychrilyobacter sp. S5]REI40224.1 DNA-directed RNA polymerase subunit alpha [Psychrilyobacter piezotolerans]
MLKIEKLARNINITEEKTSEFSGSYVVEPLYRGYGNTIGNALRRVLLSSIPGTAIKGVRIDGVLNEFSTMEGVKEAVTDVVLNVKEIIVKADEPGEKKMTLSIEGPRVVTAADIIPDAGIEVINPDHVICTVTTDRRVDMEFIVDTGEGFVVADEIDNTDWSVEYIPVDAIYTPIKKVSYSVVDTMVGRQTDFDKLTLNVATDGSVEIRDAISYAVELLSFHLNPFLEIGDRMDSLRDQEEEELNDEPVTTVVVNNVAGTKIEELDLTVRSFNCLKKAGIEDVGQLSEMGLTELLKIKNLGRKSLDEILDKMRELGFDLQGNNTSN